jgi:hypothetical protein
MSEPAPAVRIAACECVTPLGETRETWQALCDQRVGWQMRPVLGDLGGDEVPLAIMRGRAFDETKPPSWTPWVRQLVAQVPPGDWGSSRRPVIVTSSNFGVGNLYAYRRTDDNAHLRYGTPFETVRFLRRELGWGPNVTIFSHACVTAHLGLLHGSRLLAQNWADEVLVFSFDFVSPFVAAGFHALKILNGAAPAPYEDRAVGSVALGDGAAFAVLTRDRGGYHVIAQELHNEMHHFTANRADGTGFAACIEPVATAARGRRLWLKGHGTGTLEAGRLEAQVLQAAFPGAPLVSWKGSLGHTLGSCGLVELALVLASLAEGRAPGTVGSTGPTFTPEVAVQPFATDGFDAVLCTSNAFGGAHATFLVTRD